jgi:hypothetical protein
MRAFLLKKSNAELSWLLWLDASAAGHLIDDALNDDDLHVDVAGGVRQEFGVEVVDDATARQSACRALRSSVHGQREGCGVLQRA